MKTYLQAYLRGLKIISRSEQGPRLGCTGLLFASLFLLMGVIFSFYTGNRIHLECTRLGETVVDCQIQSRWYGLIPLSEIQVGGLEGASLDEHCDEDDCTYRIVLAASETSFPLTEYYSANRAKKENVIWQIQAFLEDPGAVNLTLNVGGAAEVGVANSLPPILIGLGLVFAVYALRSMRQPGTDQPA